jgi:hypothetical protein
VTNATELKGGAIFDGTQVVAPVDLIRTYDRNPRDPADTDFRQSESFRQLVQSIEQVGITNPLQVFLDKDGKFHLISGHRRLAAVMEIERQKLAAWEANGRNGDKPELGEYIPVSIQAKPESKYLRQMAMWNAEETKADWPESRRFNFFCETFEAAPPHLQADLKKLGAELGMRPSTVRTYLKIREVPALRKAMGDPSDSPIPRAGRHKSIRSIARLLSDLVKHRGMVVRVATGRPPNSDQAKEILAELLLAKRRQYQENLHLSVGPGQALERTLPLISSEHHAEVTDEELIAWLSGSGVLRLEYIGKRENTSAQSIDPDGKSLTDIVKGSGRIRGRPGALSEAKLDVYVDEVNALADFSAEAARKARAAQTQKRMQ